jgi:hypothetical protein
MNGYQRIGRGSVLGWVVLLAGCGASSSSSNDDGKAVVASGETCMACHNGSSHDDYGGGGLENPHPFPGAGTIKCTTCHGGDGQGLGPAGSHVPPPPEIGDAAYQIENAEAYFNRLTLTGIDKFPDYTVNGQTYSALDYLQFINPGDLRVVTQRRSCGQCHQSHAECVSRSLLATEAGVFSGALYAIGVDNQIAGHQGLFLETAADLAFRAVTDPGYAFDPNDIGGVGQLLEFPVFSVRNQNGAADIFQNPAYDSPNLPAGQLADGRVVAGSPLANLYHEQVAFTCGNCHLGSAGANDRYGDFRSSGCTACHMRYSLDGRSQSTDPNILKFEPFDPDDIDPPERAHVQRHRILSVARTQASGEVVPGIDDYTCAGCHQGSNRTVMQYWGIRLDQNQDVHRGDQYPANPVDFETTANDPRLFDPVVDNNTFNGRNHRQYLLFEDYDGDGRDDTPADVHYEAGLGCIDCHGSHDLHGGTVGDPGDDTAYSRQEQAVAIRCESCHGDASNYASTVVGTTYDGQQADLALDAEGLALKHVRLESDGHYYLTSRLTGNRHFVPQVRDIVVDSGKVNPLTSQPLFSAKGSYAMGRDDGNPTTGLGPHQTGAAAGGFSHMDNMSCVACHASWTNNCIGCHLSGEYDNGNNFSNITGERIVFKEDNADFVYQSPVFFQLGVNAHDKIAPITANTDVFFQYEDRNNVRSQIFSFSDRQGQGADPGGTGLPSMAHNVMMPHSIRGKVTSSNEGPRYCVACHLTTSSLANFGTEYNNFLTAMATADYGALDYNLLQSHIGQNPGNQLDSPLWVHAVSGLGSGLFLFDQDGCAVNPLDDNAQRVGCNDVAPSASFDPARAVFDLDRLVDPTGVSAGSNNHALLNGGISTLRDGALFPGLSGPLGATLLQRLTDPNTGIILDSWIDADGASQGDASTHMGQ